MNSRYYPTCVLLMILSLSIPQAIQFTRQLTQGYRPFLSEPTPTFFSWDMFANRVERCNLEWDKPLDFSNHQSITSLTQLGPKLEWGVNYNSVRDYDWVRGYLCHLSRKTVRIRLDCFVPEGREIFHELDCSKI